MEIRIRPMTLDDVPQVHRIDQLSFTLPWTERSFRFEVTGNPSARNWVAEVLGEDGRWQLAGLTVIWIIIDEAHIGTFAVHPDYRRKGVGRRMLAESLLAAQRDGAKTALLEVRRGNSGALALYQDFGFEIVGTRPRYYRDNNEDALLMTLPELNPERLRAFASSGESSS